MPKILIAECKQEVSTFNPFLSRYDDFHSYHGDALLAAHRGGRMEIGGALSVFDAQPDIELVPAYGAHFITSGGMLAGADFDRIASEFLDAIRAAPPVDGVYFSLHGAMAAENELDPEGYLLAEARRILGEDVPLVISMDLHGILTERMVQQVDALTAFHTYPHVDFYDTGVRAARLLLRIMAWEVQPVIARVPVPALVRGDELITETGLFGEVMRAAQAIEQTPTGLAAAMFIGNPFTDVPELQTYSVVITDNDPVTAERAAVKLAADFWDVRERLQAPLIPLDEAVQIARNTTGGAVIFTDAADATSSGASGDSSVILQALLAAGYTGRTLIPFVDPPAVAVAFAAGVGETIATTLGGQMDPRFTPVPVQARVRLLSDGSFINESHGSVWQAGPTAVLEADNFTFVVTSRAVSLYDRSLFLAHGQNPQYFDLVVVKSPHCQPQFFDEWAAINVNVDAPGSTSANLHSLGHTRCPRPIFPLDGDFAYTPQAQIFRRR
jgi:microcystin degradation protein MlrC